MEVKADRCLLEGGTGEQNRPHLISPILRPVESRMEKSRLKFYAPYSHIPKGCLVIGLLTHCTFDIMLVGTFVLENYQ